MTRQGDYLIAAEHAGFCAECLFKLFVIQTRIAFCNHQNHVIFNFQ